MRRRIIILTDYKGFFGSKQKSKVYNGGMDLDKLNFLFSDKGYEIQQLRFSRVDFRKDSFEDAYIVYTSSEDRNLYYKDYIEDVLLGIKLKGGLLIPEFKFFRAHNNKIFMEILRDLSKIDCLKTIRSYHFGTLQDINFKAAEINFPLVIKKAEGSKSRGVYLIKKNSDFLKYVKRISRSIHFRDLIWEQGRRYKYLGYIRNSQFRKKFIIQTYVEGLTFDWKVLIFSEKYYILKRSIKKGDFRASGSGILSYTSSIPKELLDYALKIYTEFDVPFISLDIGLKDGIFHLFEYQVIYFGTYTLEYSEYFFIKNNNEWIKVVQNSTLEEEFVNSIHNYIMARFPHQR